MTGAAGRSAALVIVVCLLAAACSGSSDVAASEEEIVTSTTVPTAITTQATSAQATTAQATSTTERETTTMATERPEPICQRLTGFDDNTDNRRWAVVNDDVMGGRSLGGLAFEEERLIFAGEINTDGGGFASLRLPLEPGSMSEFRSLQLRAKPDGRQYMVTLDDDLASRNRRVSHRAPLPFSDSAEWQTVTVNFDDLFPAIFGQPIEDLPFRPDLATRLGLMISDGVDGAFRLDVDWIDLCP